MTTDFSKLKPLFHIPEWRPMAPALNSHVPGCAIVSDPRGNGEANPYIYQMATGAVLNRFLPLLNEHSALPSPALAGSFAAGACAILHPTQGPRGTLTTGNTTTKVVLSTALLSDGSSVVLAQGNCLVRLTSTHTV